MLNISKKEGQKGFTLIEIMVVLVLLGILATISVPIYSNYVRKAQISEAITNVDALATAIRVYKMETGNWPSLDDLTNNDSGDNDPIVHLSQYYFTIGDWNKDASNLEINIEANEDKFGVSGDFKYTISESDYKGTWEDGTNELLKKYAPSLLEKS